MGLANWLTILRIVLIPAFVMLLVYRRPGWALAVFTLAALTDLADGWVARRRRSQSRLGAFLDPLADKLLLTASFVTLSFTGLRLIPKALTITVLSRDLLLVVGALLIHLLGGRLHPRPTRAGKVTTLLQVATVMAAMLSPYLPVRAALPPLIWLTGAFTVASGLQYLVQGLKYLNAIDAAEREQHEQSLLR